MYHTHTENPNALGNQTFKRFVQSLTIHLNQYMFAPAACVQGRCSETYSIAATSNFTNDYNRMFSLVS